MAPRTTTHVLPLASQARRVAVIIAVAILAVAASGVPAALAMCVPMQQSCGDMCQRCSCKQHASRVHMRAPCPCCSRDAAPAGVTVQTEPAIAAPLPSFPSIERVAALLPEFREASRSADRHVPHPPPRARLA